MATTTVIEANTIVLPKGEVREGTIYVTIKGDRIVTITTEPPTSFDRIINTHLLVPGFIDLHTHGLGKYMYMYYRQVT